jgi:hypothetical protein
MPGGALAGIGAAIWLNKRDRRPTITAAATTAALVIACITINQLLLQASLSS